MSLRKGSTFHSPTTPDRELPHHFSIPSLPRRSQSTLEDVVDAHQRRVALTLGAIDRGLSAVADTSFTARQSFPDEADPVPRSFLDHTVGGTGVHSPIMDQMRSKDSTSDRRVLRPRQNRRPSRYADSGLGSSVASSKHEGSSLVDDNCAKPSGTVSAISRSAAAHPESLPRLSVRASNRIQEHILKPLLAKSSLKDFHPIVRDCPRRVNDKEIVCLRDLEKTLMFMAPVSKFQFDDVAEGVAHWFSCLKERTKTAALYLDFCLTSIRCIQATVEFLNEREQTRPHDRPYTNGYFVDLVDQIKQHAQQVQSAKEKEEKGEMLDDLDHDAYVPSHSDQCRVADPVIRHRDLYRTRTNTSRRADEIRLHGGLMENGKPAELVRIKKNGKAISMRTGEPVDLDEDNKVQFKRSLSEEAEDDESILRSMARRKRSASAAELAPKRCREPGCDKEFKRPCDLTKHEKTHSRPWKCPVENCKYNKYGWPTEKEMDRHHNDKHSSAPPLYECHFKPCPYRSKRESNCKQHMEKAHGWEYVRSKNNGKNRDKHSNNGLPTPQTTIVRTPSSDGNAVNTPQEDDVDLQWNGYSNGQNLDFPQYNPNHDVDMFGTSHQLQLDYSPISEMTNSTSSYQSPFMGNTMDEGQFQDNFQDFGTNGGDFNLYDSNEDLYSANIVQLPTPNHEVFQRFDVGPFDTSGIPFGADPVSHVSPMLYTPTSLRDVDEGFSEDYVPQKFDGFAPNNNHFNDFRLFPGSTEGTVASSASSALFGEIPTSTPNFTTFNGQGLLDFYAASTQAATGGNLNNHTMDWSDDQLYNA